MPANILKADTPSPPPPLAPIAQAEEEVPQGRRRMPDYVARCMIRLQGGRVYLPAAQRLVWFRDECPDWGIETRVLEGGQEAGFATVQAVVTNYGADGSAGPGRVVATGIKTETRQDFPAGWVEKAETGAIARALAVAGFGTQFAPEMDEVTPADSPQGGSTSAGGMSPGWVADLAAAERAPFTVETYGERVAPADVWPGPGQCPRCYAPAGKRHGARCR